MIIVWAFLVLCYLFVGLIHSLTYRRWRYLIGWPGPAVVGLVYAIRKETEGMRW